MAIDNSGGGAGYAAMIPQLVGAGVQLATARPTAQERQQRRIAMGAPDPAVEALRRRLATQQLQNAYALAAGQPGVNPALALRQAQAGLAQSEAATAAQLAGQQAESVRQARSSDPMGRRRDALLSGVGSMLNVLGTGVATQAAGRQAAEADQAAAAKMALATAPTAAEGMAAPAGVDVVSPPGTETTVALPPTVAPTVEPAAAPTVAQGELGSFQSAPGAGQPVAEGAPPAERPIGAPEQAAPPAPAVTAPAPAPAPAPTVADQVQAQLEAGMSRARLPGVTTPSAEVEGTGLSTADRDQMLRQDTLRESEPGRAGGDLGPTSRPVRAIEYSAQMRERRIEQTRASLPPAVANDARNQALIESLTDAEDLGDPELVRMIRALLAAEGVL